MKPSKINICQYCNNEISCYTIMCVICEILVPICEECFSNIESRKHKPVRNFRHEHSLKLNSIRCKSCRREDALKNIFK